MSGDVQPRKRKDKKKKRESLDVRRSEGELIFSRKSSLQDDEASHGVHVTKMGSDDVLLHVHEEHGTGGHWCAKIIFFSLMALLMGLVCLIILENRGLSDVDTPLSESRFSNYFDGWVEEHRDEHDDHHDSHGSLEHDDHEADEEHDDEEDDHDEPFEEEADHSEGDEEVAEEEDENVTPEDDEDNATAENATAEDEDNEEEDEDEEEDNITAEVDDNVTAEEADDEENATGEDDNVTKEQNDDDEDDDANKTNEDEEEDNATKETSNPTSQTTPDDDEDPFDEDDDDGNLDSLEKIVDNDAAELELLKEKARQQAAESKQNTASAENDAEDEADNAPSWASSQIKPKTGGGPQSVEDDDLDLFEKELRNAHNEMMRERYVDALKSYQRLLQKYPDNQQVYLATARAYERYSEQTKSNRLLMEAVKMYENYLRTNVKSPQLQEYRSVAVHCLEKMRFLGQYRQSIPIFELVLEQFPNESTILNDYAINYLMLDRLSDAKRILQDILKLFPKDGLALVNYGYVLKQLDKDYQNAAIYLRQGIESKAPGTQVGRFYFQLGEALQRLGKRNEALEIFRQGADLKLYPSAYQRSLYNVRHLKAQPFWSNEETSYEKYLEKLQNNWLAIKAEGENILSKNGYFLDESENLRNKGVWQEFELFRRGVQRRENCLKAPITCNLIIQFPAAKNCRRGQVKFSVMQPGTHVWPHCGPTNCRLRAHLGLKVPNGTRLRVAQEERSWQEGKFLVFDDSFEHEVWHEGEGLRLVLIVDIWHPDLTDEQRDSLSSI